MIELTEKQLAGFCHRSYTAVDGMWFMKVEEKYGFDVALEIDNEVWRVMPKIQARMIKSMTNVQQGMEALCECFGAKLASDGFSFKVEKSGDGRAFSIIVKSCPWYDLMIKSGREHLSAKVGDRICNTEYAVWAAEFGDDIRFELREQLCNGCESCVLEFKQDHVTG